MTESAKSTRAYWILFFISLVVMILLLAFMSAWFWVALPFVGTFLVQALDAM